MTFDSARTDGNVDSSTEVHSMQFVARPLNAGQHTIKVRSSASEIPSYFGISTPPLLERASIEGLGERLQKRVGGGTYSQLLCRRRPAEDLCQPMPRDHSVVLALLRAAGGSGSYTLNWV